ncbi:glycosyltransferase family 4 protein [Pseudomonas sp. CFBP 8770]|uniref:glycosyltransferase family 4 protein n=1 Tax=unclassified Pseudomonas TaxID=196821 RepID=UPI0017868838|nr:MULTISPECIES: glycosyltransferase family 1 protein [unclassified Pseudomonas]MBD8472769.1 glycosyltransferase family 4 protein [Pseudomonas sp. CFBP 8773]MBD8646129.1 glycosyltransferase family 4 protein [Pseudomonas sp. CFBP 8770]
MRIVIDMQGAQTESRFRGIGRYSLSLAQGIARNRGEHEVYLVLNGMLSESVDSIRTAFIGLLAQSHIRVWYAQGPVSDSDPSNQARRDAAQLIRQACIDELQPDVVHITSSVEGYIDDAVIGAPVSVGQVVNCATLYDLIPLVNPGQYLDPNPLYKAHYLKKVDAFRDYDLLLSISNFARDEALGLLALDSDKVVNVSTAADDVFGPMPLSQEERLALENKFGLRERFVLYSGGADERKNLASLIKAFASIKADVGTTQLVFAGKMPQFHVDTYTALAKAQGLSPSDLIFTGYITDYDLVALYGLCRLYVFPSRHEGFGLPPLEAMKCGAAVIGSNTSSVPEVIGWDEAMFDPADVEAIAHKISRALNDDEFRTELVEHGIRQAREFSWDRTGKAAISAFESAVAKASSLPVSELQSKDRVQLLVETLAASGALAPGVLDIPLLAKAIDYSVQGLADKPTLFVDISELCKHDGKSGIQRVVRSILLEWLKNAPDGYIVKPVYTKSGEPFYRYAAQFTTLFLGKDVSEAEHDEAISYKAGDVYLCLDLLMDVLPHKQAYLDTMRAHGVNIFFVVYDLLILQLPHCFVDSLQEHYIKWINTVALYDGALCISHAVAEELKSWLAANMSKRDRPFRIGAFHLGADIDQSMPSTGFPENPALRIESLDPHPNFLMVGTLEPRKGHAQALDAFELLWAADVEANLIIVGKHGWLVDELAARLIGHEQLGKRLLWLEGASDEYLEHLYNHSDCLVAASYGEGFGLPLIEAAQYALPIVARDLPVFREVAGEHAYYFAGASAQDIADSLTRWLELHEQGLHPRSDSMPWLTWKGSAQQLIGEIDKCAF